MVATTLELHAFVYYPLSSGNHRNCSRFPRDDSTMVSRCTRDIKSSEMGPAHSPVRAPHDSHCSNRTWNTDPLSSGKFRIVAPGQEVLENVPLGQARNNHSGVDSSSS